MLTEKGVSGLYVNELFHYSTEFISLLQNGVEMGRSFVQAQYWNSYALDYLWQGIGKYLVNRPDISWLYGPVSISASYPPELTAHIVYFFNKWFGSTEALVTPRNPYHISTALAPALRTFFSGESYQDEYRKLKAFLKMHGYSIPVLYKQYSELCERGGVRFLGFNLDTNFMNCIDGLILVNLNMLKEAKRERYLSRETSPRDL